MNTPSYLRPDYPYQPTKEQTSNTNLYELRCANCTFLIRSQYKNIQALSQKLAAIGCPHCHSTDPFITQRVCKV